MKCLEQSRKIVRAMAFTFSDEEVERAAKSLAPHLAAVLDEEVAKIAAHVLSEQAKEIARLAGELRHCEIDRDAARDGRADEQRQRQRIERELAEARAERNGYVELYAAEVEQLRGACEKWKRDMDQEVAEVERLRAERETIQLGNARRDAHNQAAGRREALRLDHPWPVPSILARLADATDHLLNAHDCDHLGYEAWCAARDAARHTLRALAAAEPGEG